MFSDTHFHYRTMTTDRDVNGIEVLEEMARRNCKFGLDIGTKADDLLERQSLLEKEIAQIHDYKLADKVRDFLYFSAGIWPDVDSIHNRFECMKKLEEQIKAAEEQEQEQDILHRKVVAIGEGGIDHHWNPSGVDGRCESDFDQKTYEGERELFEMQLELSRKMDMPYIVHSRDGFEDTLDCIKNIGWNKGIIHCYSYGLEEAKAFLDLGWYISLSGSVTYTKKAKLAEMEEMIRYIPEDRLLCETDAPYLAPVPERGTVNTPVKVEHTYNFVAKARSIEVEKLCETVDKNIEKLFNVVLK
ncbi:MAG: TatD family hydrolase [Spirochaetia bacterium]|nr:TatD family hydrolase [Spirochaetia bacterium]MDY4986367.1 TatD family hydrolase [Treponema sp.]